MRSVSGWEDCDEGADHSTAIRRRQLIGAPFSGLNSADFGSAAV
jgi:hypothetical protein